MDHVDLKRSEKKELISFLSSVDEDELEKILTKFYYAFRNEKREKKKESGVINEHFFSALFSERQRLDSIEYSLEKDLVEKGVGLRKDLERYRPKGRTSKVASTYNKKYHLMCLELSKEGWGTRAIAKVLKRKFNFKISHTYLNKLLKNIPD